jgi:hypothetical protein
MTEIYHQACLPLDYPIASHELEVNKRISINAFCALQWAEVQLFGGELKLLYQGRQN